MKVSGLATVLLLVACMVSAVTAAPQEYAPVAAIGPPMDEAPAAATADATPKKSGTEAEEAPGSIVVEAIVLGAILAG